MQGNEVNFLYVFNGCYKVSIKLDNHVTWESDPIAIKTEHEKKLLTDNILKLHDCLKTE